MKGLELAKRINIIDTHIDVPYRVYRTQEDVSQPTTSGDFDYYRAQTGCLNAAFMAVFIPPSLEGSGKEKQLADELCDIIDNIVKSNPDKFAHLPEPDVDDLYQEIVYLPKALENGAGLEESIDNLIHFFKRGVRYITLTHAEDNNICDSSYATTRKWKGLSPFGKELIYYITPGVV